LTEADIIREQAATWVVRSQVPGFPKRQAFEAWCESDDRHAEAFDRAERLWAELGGAAVAHGERRARGTSYHPGRRERRIVGFAVAASLLLMIGVGLSDDFTTLLQADLQTSPGRSLTRELADGSTIQLDSRSAVAVQYSESERRIVLLRGQLFVDASPVGPGEARPFVVEAKNGLTRALGTTFNVNSVNDTVEIAAVTHKIAVSTGSSRTTATLSPGQGARYGPSGKIETIAALPALATAWRHGRIVIDRASLTEACALLARYSDRPVHLWSDRGDTLRVSGVFEAGNVEGALAQIAQEHSLRLKKVPLLGFVLR
jgi:transmembrane sensor